MIESKKNNCFVASKLEKISKLGSWDVLGKIKLAGEESCQGKNDYNSGGIFYGLFLAPEIKYCLAIAELGNIEEHKTFKSFDDGKRLLVRSQ